MNFLPFPLEELPFFALAAIAGLTVHEFAHAWTAYKCGDDTARQAGRVTLNPMAHLDLFGSLLLLVAGFGWAKPVPVRRGNFRHPRAMSVLVTAAGPLSNLLLAALGVFLLYALHAANVQLSGAALETWWTFIKYWLHLNLILLLFNLIPLPPLDGYRIIEEFLPLRLRLRLMQAEQWSFFLFLLLVFVPPLRRMTIDPLFSLMGPILGGISSFMQLLFGGPKLF